LRGRRRTEAAQSGQFNKGAEYFMGGMPKSYA
jgi:hypothetical protein